MTTTSATPADSLTAAAASGQGVVAWYAQGFSDRLGDRLLLFDNTGAAPLELLRLAERVTGSPDFEPALRARVDQLKPFRHPAFARVRGVSVLSEPVPQLALVSEHIPGERLSNILRAAQNAGFRPDPSTGVWLVRQLLSALGALHEMGTGIAHGTLSPDRIVVTPAGDLVVTEYVLGQALDQIAAPKELWTTLGVAVDPDVDPAEGPGKQVDPGKDVQQVALLALAVLLGRPLRDGEYPARMNELLNDACDKARWSFIGPLRAWLARALAVKTEWRFESATEAVSMLDTLVPLIKGTWSPGLLPQSILPAAQEATERAAAAADTVSAAPSTANAAPPRSPLSLLASVPLEGPPALLARAEAPAVPRRGGLTTLGLRDQSPQSEAVVVEDARHTTAALIHSLRQRGPVFAAIALAEAACLALVLWRGAPNVVAAPSAAPPVATLAAGTVPPVARDATSQAGADGWISVIAPTGLDVRVDGVLRARRQSHTRVALSPGRHHVQVSDTATGFEQSIVVTIVAGQGVALEPRNTTPGDRARQ